MEITNTVAKLTVSNADLSASSFDDVNLAQAIFNNINMDDVTFSDMSMQGVIIRDANLTGMVLDHCTIEGVFINGVSLADMMAAYAEKQEVRGLKPTSPTPASLMRF